MRRVLRILRRVERMTWTYPPQLLPVLAVLVQCVAAVQFATLLLAGPSSTAAAAEPVQGAGTVSGQALWAEGIPSAGTHISAIVVTPPNPVNRAWLGGEKVAASTVTDGDGRYRIEALAPGRYHIVSGPVNLPRFFSDVAMAANPHVVTVAAGTVVNNVDFTIVQTNGFPHVPGKLLTVTGKLNMKAFGSAGGGIFLLVQNSDGSTTRWYVRRVQMPVKFWWPGYAMKDIQDMVNAGETVTYTGTEIPNWGTNNAALAGTRAIDPVEATRGGK